MIVGYIRVQRTSIPIVEKPVMKSAARRKPDSGSLFSSFRDASGRAGGGATARNATTVAAAIARFAATAASEVRTKPKDSTRTTGVKTAPARAPATFARYSALKGSFPGPAAPARR